MHDIRPIRLLFPSEMDRHVVSQWQEALELCRSLGPREVIELEVRPAESLAAFEDRLRFIEAGRPDGSADTYRTFLAQPSASLTFWGLRNASVFPHEGLVITADGEAILAPSAMGLTSEKLARLDRFASVPGFRLSDEGAGLSLDHAILDSAPWIPGASIFSSHAAHGTYGHWFFDCVPPLYAARQAFRAHDLRLLTRPLAEWQRETILGLGLGDAMVVRSDAVVRCEMLLVPSFVGITNARACGPITNEAMAAVREGLLAGRTKRSRIVYVSRRSDSARRRMTNEEALEDALEARGAAVLRPESMSLREQVELAASADILVSPIGSGSMNIGFAPPGATLIEIVPRGYVDPVFCRLALTGGQSYIGLQDEAPFPDHALRAFSGFRDSHEHFSYRVDVKRLLDLLDQLEGRAQAGTPAIVPVAPNPGRPLAEACLVMSAEGSFSVRAVAGEDGGGLGAAIWSGCSVDDLATIWEPLFERPPALTIIEADEDLQGLIRRLVSLEPVILGRGVLDIAHLAPPGNPAAEIDIVWRLGLLLATGQYGMFDLAFCHDAFGQRLLIAAASVTREDLSLLSRDAPRLKALPGVAVPVDIALSCTTVQAGELIARRGAEPVAHTLRSGSGPGVPQRCAHIHAEALARSCAALDTEGAIFDPLIGRYPADVPESVKHLVSLEEAGQILGLHPNAPHFGPFGQDPGLARVVFRNVPARDAVALSMVVAHGHKDSVSVRFGCRIRSARTARVLAERAFQVEPGEWSSVLVPFEAPEDGGVHIELMSAMSAGETTNRHAWARILRPLLVRASS